MNRNRTFLLIVAGASLAALAAAAAPQAAQPPPPAAVEVRVNVSANGQFQEDLKLEDFSLLEDGRPQKIASVTLVKGGGVARFEGDTAAVPRLDRSYTLLFQAVDWDPKLVQAIEYLFGSILQPGDGMTLITPFKPYQLQKDALAHRTNKELSDAMEDVLRKDILRGSGEYRELIGDLRRLTRAISGDTAAGDEDLDRDPTIDSQSGFGLEMHIERYRQALMKLDGLRLVDEGRLLAFADALKPGLGQKTVVLFYQKEYRPQISPATLSRLMALNQDNFDILSHLMDLFQFYKREKTFDADKVKKAFADAGIDFHFIFMEKKSQRVFGATMKEQSEDTYPGFVEIARATGGTAGSSQNPAVSFKRAAEASNVYYILCYAPEAAAGEGGFRTIEVRVARPGCQVTNRLGYYAK